MSSWAIEGNPRAKCFHSIELVDNSIKKTKTIVHQWMVFSASLIYNIESRHLPAPFEAVWQPAAAAIAAHLLTGWRWICAAGGGTRRLRTAASS
jgi:hypothetical protein